MKNYAKLLSLMENELRLKALIELKVLASAMNIAEVEKLSIDNYELNLQRTFNCKQSMDFVDKTTKNVLLVVDISEKEIEFSSFSYGRKRELIALLKTLPLFRRELNKKQKELIDQMSSLL